MRQAWQTPLLKRWADDFKSRQYLTLLKQNNLAFDGIRKALDEFIEKKRELFQRFYFLSNEELLEIYARVKSPAGVLPHLRKIFDSIDTLELDGKDNALCMVSAEGESVKLRRCSFRGEEVEEWLRLVVEQMRESLKQLVRSAFASYEKEETQFTKWILDFPSQIILAIDHVNWTRFTEDYLTPDNELNLAEWYQARVINLQDLAEVIRREAFSSVQRRAVCALITQDVHFRDTVSDLLCSGTASLHDFKWQSQLRFYLCDSAITVKQIEAAFSYGYEYTGGSPRLVQTPLTDRCWATISQAIHLKLGCSPVGPSGTGKTESCKDIAKVLARYCFVFNCAQNMNIQTMLRIFAGACSTGCWVCLDEFNKIDSDTLSVVASQLLCVREALLRGRDSFLFFGRSVRLPAGGSQPAGGTQPAGGWQPAGGAQPAAGCACLNPVGLFATYNPFYKNRFELPENLKSQFRAIGMTIPDYEQISEILLFAEGFSQAKRLAAKVTKLHRLCAEQLPQVEHYDFGMRAIKSVIQMAGNYLRQDPAGDEGDIIQKAVWNTNIPRLVEQDQPMFKALLQDLFPDYTLGAPRNEALSAAVAEAFGARALRPTSEQLLKSLQLNEIIQIRFGTIVVGAPMTGKTTIIQSLRDAHGLLEQQRARRREQLDYRRALERGEVL